MRDFRNIQVWHKSHALVLAVYEATGEFPAEERFGLVSQMRRASTSIPTNIAEGCGRSGDAELARFMQIGMGSASELEYLLLLTHDLKLLPPEHYANLQAQTVEVKKMLSSFIRHLRKQTAES